MAKKPKAKDDRVLVMATAKFRHDGIDVRIGETLKMARLEALDMRALNMIHPLEPLERANG